MFDSALVNYINWRSALFICLGVLHAAHLHNNAPPLRFCTLYAARFFSDSFAYHLRFVTFDSTLVSCVNWRLSTLCVVHLFAVRHVAHLHSNSASRLVSIGSFAHELDRISILNGDDWPPLNAPCVAHLFPLCNDGSKYRGITNEFKLNPAAINDRGVNKRVALTTPALVCH